MATHSGADVEGELRVDLGPVPAYVSPAEATVYRISGGFVEGGVGAVEAPCAPDVQGWELGDRVEVVEDPAVRVWAGLARLWRSTATAPLSTLTS